MLRLEQDYRQYQQLENQQLANEGILPPPPNQDEDVDTDEDLMIRNIKDVVTDFKKSI